MSLLYALSSYTFEFGLKVFYPAETHTALQNLRINLSAVHNYSRLSLSRNRRDPLKQFEISVIRHIRFVVLRKKQFEQPNFTNDYVI